MKLIDYLRGKITYIVSQFIVLALTVSIIWILNPALSMLIGVLYIIGAIVPLTAEYTTKRSFYNNLLKIFDELDRKNLIAEMINRPSFVEGIVLYDIVKGCNKAMIEEINKYKYMQEEYREYIELWVHEVKTPIASSRLIAQNNRNIATDSISEELEKIENFVEQALFYSRSNTVEKDYIIKETNLKELCFDVLKKDSKLFIHNEIRVDTENLDKIVYCDDKWLKFILSQILTNSAKYMNKPEKWIKISAEELGNSIILSVEDNGAGIRESEVTRIFEKGFTGTNGRKNERSTGMGLYICKKLCDKLGLAINGYSKFGEGTTMSIVFPKNSMTDII